VAGAFCDYPLSGVCGDYQCMCDPAGNWSCVDSTCIDAGTPVDAGPPPDAAFPSCPPAEPAQGTFCPQWGEVCSYGFCPTNCLCDNGVWVCSAQTPCVDGG
jgi:hypothetical protein